MRIEMKRLILPALLAIALGGCNFSDDVTFPGDTNNGTNPNNSNNGSNDNNTTADMGGGDDAGNNGGSGATVDITNVLVNGNSLPTDVLAGSGDFQVAATVTATNSADCDGCNIQVVIGVPDGGAPDCLIDAPAGSGITGSATLTAPETAGARQLLYQVYEEADCDAALALATDTTNAESLGQITFTPPEDLSVLAIDPATDALNVVVDSTVRIGFNGPIDAGSVTGRVRLAENGTAVAATVSVEGNDIVVTPQDQLKEFQTVYTVTVTAGITSGTRTLENDYNSMFTTRMFVPDVYYTAYAGFHGQAYSLTIDSANQCSMTAGNSAPAQQFRFVPRDNGNGWVGYNSNPISASRALSGGDGTNPCIMVPIPAGGPDPGQVWRFKRQANGTFWMQNQMFNEALSLDATAVDLTVTGNTAAPLMQTTLVNEAQETRQDWVWRRAQ